MNWQDLAAAVNAKPGHQVLDTHFFVSRDPNIGATFLSVEYVRWSLLSMASREGLLTMRLGWVAKFHPALGRWIWVKKPNADPSVPVEILDTDVSQLRPALYDDGSVRVDVMMFCGGGKLCRYDALQVEAGKPLSPVDFTESDLLPEFTIEGGVRILPPNYKNVPFLASEVLDIK